MTPAAARPGETVTWGWVVVGAAVVLAIAFQIQATPRIGGNAVRLSLADLVSPLVLLAFALAAARRAWQWPRWTLPRLWIWLGALSVVMAAALIVGRVTSGVWLPWAVVNKFGGWFALVWYLVAGGIVAATLGRDGIERFFAAFLVFLWISCAVSIVGLVLFQADLGPPTFMRYNRAEGFMQNPNAFGVLIAVGLSVQLPYARSSALFGPWWHRIGLALALTALVLTGSRTAWLSAIFALALLSFARAVPWRSLCLAAFAAAVLVFLLLFVEPAFLDARPANYQSVSGGYVFNEPMFSARDRGLAYRFDTAMTALGLWWREPILGTGLGGFPFHLIKAGKPAEVIHSTYVWILAEMGVVGFVAFAAFFITILRTVWRRLRADEDPRVAIVALAMLCAFAGAALGMEAMYQRHLWFILGLALAVPALRPVAAPARRVE